MAAGLGFKTFAVGEILSAANVNGYLMQGVLVFANATARDAAITSPQEGQFAYLKDTNVTTYYTGSAWANLDTTGMTNPMTTTGDTIYSSSGSTPARLGIGSTGQVLTVAGGIPSWASASSGKLVAIQTTIKTDTFTTASTSYVDVTGLSVSITPTSASSQILVLFQVNGSQEVGVARASLKLLRDSTVINAGAAAGSRTPALGGFSSLDQSIPSAPVSGSIYDSPATTSSVTYKIQLAATAGGGTAYINRTQQDADNANQIRMASTITVLEIL